MNMLFLTHGGTSGSFSHSSSSGKFGLESTLEDFVEILKIIKYYLSYKLHFFGFDMSILNVIIATYVLFVCILFVFKMFGSKGD